MNLLVIDTATEACSVALTFKGQIFNRFEICPQQHSQRILPMVDEVLKEAQAELKDMDYLGFGRGPGSFTGVRIATGVIQGLALGSGLKVVGVSTLAAMAQQGLEQGAAKAVEQFQVENVYAAIDARMSEVYFARYQNSQGLMTLVGKEQVLPPEEAQTLMTVNKASVGVGTGWGAYESLNPNQQIATNSAVLYPNAKFMLALAKQQIAAGQAVEVEDIQPVYLRDKVTWKKLPGKE